MHPIPRRRRSRRRARSFYCGMVIALLGVTTACGTAPTSRTGGGDGDGPIVVGAFAGLSGPLALAASELAAGWKLGFDQVNENGGINGRNVELIIRDDNYDPAQSVAVVRDLVQNENATVITGIGTANVSAPAAYLNGQQVPMLFPLGSPPDQYEPPTEYVFLAQPTYASQGYLSTKYTIENKQITNLGIIRLDSEAGVGVAEGCKTAAAEGGVPVVGEQSYQPADTNFSGALAQLRSQGADAICTGSLLESTGIQMTQAAQTGWDPEWIGFAAQANDQLAELGGPAAQGIIATNPLLPPGADDPNAMAFRQQLAQRFPNVRPGLYSEFGYWSAHLIADALRGAGDDPSGENIRNTILAWQEHASPVGLSGALTYGPDKPNGLDSSYVAQLQGDQFLPVTDPLTAPID